MRRGYHTHACRGILSALLVACADSAVAPVSERAELADAATEANDIARGIALALASPELRATIRDAMRASPLNEHKLVLQNFVATPEGRQLAAAAARALNISDATFVQTINALPALDFYASFAKHRREWRATSDVLVAATFDPDNRHLDAYSVDGEAVRLDYEDGTPSAPLLILHPAERKTTRGSAQRLLRGETIQDPDEGRSRPVVTHRFSSVGFHPDSSYIDFFNFHEGDGWFGDSELRFVAKLEFPGGPLYSVVEIGNVEEDEGYDVTIPLARYSPRFVSTVLIIDLWEDDIAGEYSSPPIGDDHMGQVTYSYNWERGLMKHFYTGEDTDIIIDWYDGTNRIPSQVAIGPSQPTVPAGGTLQLSYSVADQAGTGMAPSEHAAPIWESLNPGVATVSSTGLVTGGSSGGSTTVRITVCPTTVGSPCKDATVPVTVQPVSPSLTVSINGPDAARPGDPCAWWSSVSGGTGSYTYSWTVDGTWQSNNYDLNYTNTGSSFTIELNVTDTQGALGSASRMVTVSSSEEVCSF